MGRISCMLEGSMPRAEDFGNKLLKASCMTDRKRSWIHYHHLRLLNFCIFLITLTSTNTGYDGSMLNGLQSLQQWRNFMKHPSGVKLGALSNGTVFGTVLSFPVAPLIMDRYGRKAGIVLGQCLTILGAILQGCSTNYTFFLVSRIIIGFGSAIAVVGSPTLITELAYPTHRQVATTFYNTCWYLGAVIAAWITYGTREIDSDDSWRLPSYMQGILAVFQLSLFWLVPDSPRFLIHKGEIDKARQVLTKFHVGNSQHPKDIEFVEMELKSIEDALEREKSLPETRYLDFFKSSGNRRRLHLCIFVPVIIQLSGNGLVSYYLSKVLDSIGIKDEKAQLQINGILMIYNWVVSIGIVTIVHKFRRRTLFMVSTVSMLITYVVWTILSAVNQQTNFEKDGLGKGVVFMIFLYYLAYNLGANGLPFLYLTEILPYSLRAKGINIMQLVMSAACIFSGFVNPVAMDAIQWKYYIVYCCILALEAVVVFTTFPETSGYSLEDAGKVLDSALDLDESEGLVSVNEQKFAAN